ncbi:MAG: hypothetical protein ACI3Y8_08850 [Candidatus Cryptobacteroides sp.]
MKKLKPKKVFISHNSLDKAYCDALFDLITSVIGKRKSRIFYSSNPWYGVPNGKDLLQVMKEQYDKYELFMIIVSSPRYYKSPKSLNEMGAAWVLNSKIDVFMTADSVIGDLKGVINSDFIAIRADDPQLNDRLEMFKKELIKFFKVKTPTKEKWEKAKNTFMGIVTSITYEEQPVIPSICDEEYSEEMKTIDLQNIKRLFGHLSCRLMDEYSNSSLQYIDNRLPRSYEWWQYYMNLISFKLYDKKLAELVEDFYTVWDNIMYDNWKYYSPSDTHRGYYEFYNFQMLPINSNTPGFYKIVASQAALPKLNESFRCLITYIQDNFTIDLTALSETFENNPE